MEPHLETLISAVLGALGGGLGLKLLERLLDHLLSRNDKTFDQGKALRDELRGDNVGLRAEIDQLQEEVETWQQKYYELYEKHLSILSDYKMAVADGEILRKRLSDIQSQLPPKETE